MLHLNYNSTAPLAPGVFEAMEPFLVSCYGNPSEVSSPLGRQARKAIEQAREHVAALLGTGNSEEVIFASGGTESCFSGVLGAWIGSGENGRLALSAVEHPAVIEVAAFIEKIAGVEVDQISVGTEGMLDYQELDAVLESSKGVLSVMLANSETGVLFPIKEIVERAHHYGWIVHCDAIGAIGKIPVDFTQLNVDVLSVSGHKFGAPKGVGVLVVKKGIPFIPPMVGGGQERGFRGGTEAVANIVGLGVAAQVAKESLTHQPPEHIVHVRNYFERAVQRYLPSAHLTVSHNNRLPNTSSICLNGVLASDLVQRTMARGVAISAGSACKSQSLEPSHVLRAMGVPTVDCLSTIRVSFGPEATQGQARYLVEMLAEEVSALRLENLKAVSSRMH